MPKSQAKTKTTPTISELVRSAWDGADSDMPAATEALYGAVVSRQDLLNDILPKVVRSWCREQIGEYVGRLRAASLPEPDDTGRGERLRGVIARSLFDFPLPGGKRLGDANAADIRAGAEAYDRSANDAAHKARWLSRVAERVGRKNRAENALTLQQLEELFEESRDA